MLGVEALRELSCDSQRLRSSSVAVRSGKQQHAFGGVLSAFAPSASATASEGPPSRCSACNAFHSPLCSPIESRNSWTCAICRSNNYNHQPLALAVSREFEFVEEVGSTQQPETMYVFAVDANLSSSSLGDLSLSIESFCESLKRSSAKVAFLTFSDVLTVFDISRAAIVVGSVVPSWSSLRPCDKAFLNRRDMFVSACDGANHIKYIIDALASREAAQNPQEDAWEAQPISLGGRRCIGTAVEVALSLIEYSGGEDAAGRIFVCTGGHCDSGPGETIIVSDDVYEDAADINQRAQQYFQELGHQASCINVAVDLFCAGPNAFGLSRLRALASSSGGAIVIGHDFSERFAHDICRIPKRSALASRASFELLCPSALVLRRVIGPIGSGDSSHSGEATRHSFSFLSVSPDESVTCLFDIVSSTVQDQDFPLCFQIIVRFHDSNGAKICRVLNQSISECNNRDKIRKAIDIETMSVMLSKKHVLLAMKGSKITSIREQIESDIREFAAEFGEREVFPNGREMFNLSAFLDRFPRLLYHLLYGPLLGSVLQHPDDITAWRHQFLVSSLEISLQMMKPELFSVEDINCGLKAVPCHTLSLQSPRIILFDGYSQVVVWSGDDVVDDSYDEYRSYCIQIAKVRVKNRFPYPEILQCEEGSSEERWIICRLSPVHSDTRKEQMEQDSSLEQIDLEQLNNLSSKFPPTDTPSFLQFYQRLFLA